MSNSAGTSSTAAFESAVNANYGRLLGLARAMLGGPSRDAKQPEDLVQEALLKLFRQRDHYDWSDGAWSLMAKSVARNVISCRRRKLFQSLDAEDGLAESIGEDVDPAAASITAESIAALRKHIEALPDSWRDALVLREQQGLAYKDIAETLKASEAQVKTWLHRARNKLGHAMSEENKTRN